VARSAQAERLNEILRGGPKAVEMTIADQRAAGEHQEDLTSEPVGVGYEEAPELDGFWAVPEGSEPIGAVVYLYGGGYVISSPHSRRKTAGHIAHASGARVLVPRYRLAPEHPFPAAVEDATSCVAWLSANGYPADRVVIAGGSSAGGLALATLLKLKATGAPLPAAAVVLSPWTHRRVPQPQQRPDGDQEWRTSTSARGTRRIRSPRRFTATSQACLRCW
jgi:monoterpene epsilon-lactone hydrolase